MTTATPPASAQELIKQYCAAVDRTDWQAMVVAQEGLAARAEYDLAMAIRQAQQNLDWARTRLEAAQTERSVAGQALEDARERAPLAATCSAASGDLRKRAEVHAAAAWWRDQIPTREEALLAVEGRCRDADQIASDAQERLDQLLAAAYARVQSIADDAADRRVQP